MCETLQLNWKLPSGHNTSVKRKKAISNNNNNNVANKNKKKNGNYTLRACSIKKRMETEVRKTQPKKRGPKPRPRPLPMSKYRRKTANLRERERMGEINNAFENLRKQIPALAIAGKGRCEKMTKINILHVAINYIRALENIMDTGDAGVNVYGTAIVQSPFRPLPVSAEPELPLKAPSLQKKTNKRKQKEFSNLSMSSCHSSGSEDSGIVEDGEVHGGKYANEEAEGDEEEDENDMEQCPDWTELTSTLEFPPSSSPPPPPTKNLNYKKLPLVAPPTPPGGNLDTLLTVSAVSTPVTPTEEMVSILDKKKIFQPKSLNRQMSNCSFSEFLALSDNNNGDIFSDLISGADLDLLNGLSDNIGSFFSEENSMIF